jgi:hypothetical protein
MHPYLSRETYNLHLEGLGSSNVWEFRGFPCPSKLTLGHNDLTWSRPFLPYPFPFFFHSS